MPRPTSPPPSEAPPTAPTAPPPGRVVLPIDISDAGSEALRPAERDGHTRQGSFLAAVPILRGRETALREVLAEIEEDVEANPHIPFLRLRTVHFARFVIHEAARDTRGGEIPPKLLFSTNFDEPLDGHLEELLREAGPGVDRVFEHCEGYPAGEGRTRDAVVAFLGAHRIRSNTFYAGTRGRSVTQIRREAALRSAIGEFLDREQAAERLPTDPVEVRDAIVAYVRGRSDLDWALEAPGPMPRGRRLATVLGTGVAGGAALLLGGALLLFPAGSVAAVAGAAVVGLGVAVGAAALLLRRQELRDETVISRSVKEHTAKLAAREDQIVQNQMSSVINIKPGPLRAVTLRTVLAFIDLAARVESVEGTLAGIPSIHFARWVIVDEGRRLVFFSNFDGSWENYLGDFIDRAASGLTAVWSNCVGFPRTCWLVGEGARDEQRFKAYSRDSQIETQVWYSAYKRLTVQNINDNSRIRIGLCGDMDARQAQEWLRLF